MKWDDAILIGVVARPHGNRGEVIVNSETDFPEERFQVGAKLRSRRRDGSEQVLEVTSMRVQQGRPILGLAGYASINDAERLVGFELRIDADGAGEPLPEGEYYQRDLIGCAVVTAGGETIGRVTAVEGNRAASRLVVTGGRSEVLIPLAEEICSVDLASRRITVRPPEGLLDLNGDWR
ncbi:MAG: ribosome maturation factor RimM [Vicinamibacterales bacterium]